MFKRKIFQIQDETVIAKSKNYYKRKNFTASIATKVIEVEKKLYKQNKSWKLITVEIFV